MTNYLARILLRSSAIAAVGLIGLVTASAQTPPTPAANQAKTSATATTPPRTNNGAVGVPLYANYKGVALGMSRETARDTLSHLQEKGNQQDYFVFSEKETAQVYYDDKGLVKAVSVDYLGNADLAPPAATVLGETPVAKSDGSIYVRKDYPAVGYWVSYSRTAGTNPIVTITMQRLWN